MRTVAFCELDPFCRAVLAKHWPDVPCHADVRALQRIACDVICGGFPCQDVSSVGRRAGLGGHKSGLFREFIRLVAACRPGWAVAENSARGARHWVETARAEFAALGYESIAFDVAASDIGANHERNRGFVLAHAGRGRCALAAEAIQARGASAELHPWWADEPGIPRVDDGVPHRVDRARALGNAIVPQIAEIIGRAILEAEKALMLCSGDGESNR